VAGRGFREVVGLALPLLVVLAACSGSGDDGTAVDTAADQTTVTTSPPVTSAPPAKPADAGSQVARANRPMMPIYAAAGDRDPASTLTNPNENGAPLVFLVRQQQGDWLHVYLPVRPNGSTGWVRATDVALESNPYRIDIALGAHRLVVRKGNEVVLDTPIGVGTANTPTPGGVYYIKELLQPPDPNGPYGPYAYGLSGFSNVLDEFKGGDGVIGIHGTNEPEAIGTDVSHGCIRMPNEAIGQLVPVLPLGTPVHITT
jgi:lipoprotein-anchoring transpeptidase ErfK/SrfK